MDFDVELLGDCDTIIAHLCMELGELWSEVLQGFEIPNVSKEFLTPFVQTLPDSLSKDGCNEVILNDDDGLKRKCYDSGKIIENGNSLDQYQKENKGNLETL